MVLNHVIYSLILLAGCYSKKENLANAINQTGSKIETKAALVMDITKNEGFYMHLEGQINNRPSTMFLVKNEEFRYLTGYYYFNDEQIPNYITGWKEVKINSAIQSINNFKAESDFLIKYGKEAYQETYFFREREKDVITGQGYKIRGRFIDDRFLGSFESSTGIIQNLPFEFKIVNTDNLKLIHTTYSSVEKVADKSSIIVTLDFIEPKDEKESLLAKSIKKVMMESLCKNFDKKGSTPIGALKPCLKDLGKECIDSKENPCFLQYSTNVIYHNNKFLSVILSNNKSENTNKAFTYDFDKNRVLKIDDIFEADYKKRLIALLPKSVETKFNVKLSDISNYVDEESINVDIFYITGKGIIFVVDNSDIASGIHLFMPFSDLQDVLKSDFKF